MNLLSPKNLIRSIVNIITLTAEVCFSAANGNQKRNIANLQIKEDVYLLLTGQPINDASYNKLIGDRSSITLASVNSFCKTAFFEKLKPEVYFINDPIFFLEEKKDNTNRTDHAEIIAEKTSWKMHIILPSYAKNSEFTKILQRNTHIKIHYIAISPLSVNNYFSRAIYKRGYGIPRPSNVLVWALAITLWLNPKRIKIFNAPFDFYKKFSVSPNGVVHKETSKGMETHYHSSRIKGAYKPTMAEALQFVVDSYYSLYMIEDTAKESRIKIENQTPDSMLDCFLK